MLFLGRSAVSAQFPVQPLAHVPDALRGGDDVERGWDRATLLEVADPKLAPGELPLDVGAFLFLGRRKGRKKEFEQNSIKDDKGLNVSNTHGDQLVGMIHHGDQ